jgi:hypothetical protein
MNPMMNNIRAIPAVDVSVVVNTTTTGCRSIRASLAHKTTIFFTIINPKKYNSLI